VFGPTQILKDTPAGTRDIITEIQHQYDIGGEHDHQGETPIECPEPKGFQDQGQSQDVFHHGNGPGHPMGIGGKNGGLAQLDLELLEVEEFTTGRIDE